MTLTFKILFRLNIIQGNSDEPMTPTSRFWLSENVSKEVR